MDKKIKQEATDLFIATIGKKPQECGYQVIDIYKQQKAYLYATTPQKAKAYKASQNIMRWIMRWGFIPLILCIGLLLFYGMSHIQKMEDWQDPVIVAILAFFGSWCVVLVALSYQCYKISQKNQKFVCWIHY